MMEGKKSHIDQDWDMLSDEYLLKEAKEELADCWNYVERMENRDDIRDGLQIIYNMLP